MQALDEGSVSAVEEPLCLLTTAAQERVGIRDGQDTLPCEVDASFEHGEVAFAGSSTATGDVDCLSHMLFSSLLVS